MNRREKQKAETLADIMRAAKELFSEYGYEKTSIQHIAERAGLTKGAIYHHFDSKDEMVEKMYHEHYEKLYTAAKPVLEDSSLTAFEKLEKIIKASRGVNKDEDNASAELMQVRNDENNVILKERMKKYDKKYYIAVFGPVLKQARKSGEMKFSATPEIMAIFIMKLDQGVTEEISHILTDESDGNKEKHIREVLEGFVYTVSQMLNADKKKINKIMGVNESLEFFRDLLNPKKEKK